MCCKISFLTQSKADGSLLYVPESHSHIDWLHVRTSNHPTGTPSPEYPAPRCDPQISQTQYGDAIRRRPNWAFRIWTCFFKGSISGRVITGRVITQKIVSEFQKSNTASERAVTLRVQCTVRHTCICTEFWDTEVFSNCTICSKTTLVGDNS